MGQEIASSRFDARDFQRFSDCLRAETALLETWFRDRRFASGPSVAGFELEAWLVNATGRPAPVNQAYLERLDDPLVVPELSVFNVEFNTPERPLRENVLSRMHAEFEALWQRSDRVAGELGAALAMIGILPTVRERDLTIASMSRMIRYRALNEQVLRMRRGRPMQLNIRGPEVLRTEHRDVMLEAGTTSFQIHLQVNQPDAVDFYNAAVMLAAPMVAVAANSPYLFGKDLWDETRIPLFEQAVAVGGDINVDDPTRRRVTFGSGYLKRSLSELFRENLDRYPPLLPMCADEPLERLNHLRLHNGTIWRWNRPLIGFGRDGVPHVRIEHRVMAAGPSIPDMIANAALFYGAVHALARRERPPARSLTFADSRLNFYRAARNGLLAELRWLGGEVVSVYDLLLRELLPLAREGLTSLDIDRSDIDAYLGIIEARIRSGCTGARWQRAYVARHRCDLVTLTAAYLERQNSGLPVHEWDFGG
jgi:gamma-glutamyl:cysteine ligase YbdK (ATP-grasp superfamily)